MIYRYNLTNYLGSVVIGNYYFRDARIVESPVAIPILDAEVGKRLSRTIDGVVSNNVADDEVNHLAKLGIVGNVAPASFTTRTLTSADNGKILVAGSAQSATVNAGLPNGFGIAIKGTISFVAGSGVTITDSRTTGATNPWCALVQVATDVYDTVGTKA